MLVQILVAVAAACGIFIFAIRRKLRTWFLKKKDPIDSEANGGTDTSGAGTASGDSTGASVDTDDDVIDMLSDE